MPKFIGTEATGIFKGVLMEDMIDTVAREGRLYCNVYIERFFDKDSDYPLTYVPLWAMSLPLKKNDVVLIEFHQDNLMYPVLYKNPDEIDEGFYKKFEFGNFVTGGKVTKPTSEKTIGSTRLGEDSYIIKTENYTVIHQSNGFILIDKDDKIYVYGSQINLVSTGTLNIDSSGQLNLTGKGNVVVNDHLKVTI